MPSIFENMCGFFSQDLGIDLGTANTLVCTLEDGVLFSEPSVVAVDKRTGDLFQPDAVGKNAKVMLGRCPANVIAVRPLKHGVISDFNVTQTMLRYFINKAQTHRFAAKPRVVISIPSGITSVEKQAVEDSALRAGARRVYLLEEPLAAGMGAGLPIMEPNGSMIVDIGGGTTEVAVLSLGGAVASESVRTAGDDFDNAIVQYIRKNYNLLVGEQTAERIKLEIGSAYELEEELTMTIRGRDLQAMLPRSTVIHSEEIRQALMEPVSQIIQAIKNTLEKIPPQLAADLIDQGITLAGGGALLRGLDRMIMKETDLQVRVADDPLRAVARGTIEVLKNFEDIQPALYSGSSL